MQEENETPKTLVEVTTELRDEMNDIHKKLVWLMSWIDQTKKNENNETFKQQDDEENQHAPKQ